MNRPRKVRRTRAAATAAAAALALSWLPAASPVRAGCVAVYTDRYAQTLSQMSRSAVGTRHPLPAHITTVAQCEAFLRSQSIWSYDAGFRQTRCECGGSSGSGGSGFNMPTAPFGSRAFGQQLALGIVQKGLEGLLAGPKGPSPEEVARKQAAEAEARRIAEEEARRQAEEAARLAAIEKERRLSMAAGMKGADGESPVGADRGENRLAWKGLDETPTPSASLLSGNSAGSRATSSFARLRCAQAFSEAANQYRSMSGPEAAEKARFFALQAQKALSGETLDAECPAPSALSEVPMPTGIEVVHPGEGTREELLAKAKADLGFLDEVRVRRRELSDRKAAAEEKRRRADEKLAKPAGPAEPDPPAPAPDTGKPASDPEADRLRAEAEALLRESEAELAEIGKAEQSLEAEEKRLADNLKRYEAKLQALEGPPAGSAAR